jgi:putative ABC transport system substrate-binding protein
MKRREFVSVLGGAVAWPIAARAQQPGMPVVGFLHQGALEPNALGLNAFRSGLRDSGFVEGRNVKLELRWADGKYDQLPALAADLVRRQPAAIAAALLPAAQAAKAATATIPVVFISGSDPVETGLVTHLNHPGENVTGVSLFSVPLIAKRLELLHEVIPQASVVAVLVNSSNPNAEANERGIEIAARTIGLGIEFIEASSD